MKTEIKQTLRDLKAAVMLDRPEAIDIALDGLLALPGVAANDRMNESFIEKVILPVGEAISGLPSPQLRLLLTHKLAVGRAIGAVAMAHIFFRDRHATPKDLRRFASDSRSDVRLALGLALFALSKTDPEKAFILGKAWITQSSPKLRHTALIFLPALADQFDTQIFSLLEPLVTDEDNEVRASLVDVLSLLGRTIRADRVLNLLSVWSEKSRPNSWVICRTLSASWAAKFPFEVESILRKVHTQTGDSSQITNALKALERHGLAIEL